MFFVIKKRLLIIITLVLAIVIVSVAATASALAFVPALDVVVVLDAGHGGKDGGAKGIDSGVSEAEINLIITKMVEKLLLAQGIGVVLTRKDENSLETITKKQLDMNARKKIILRSKPRLVVSIHCNKFPDTNRRGAQVFFEPLCGGGKALAFCLQSNLNTLNEEYVFRSFPALKGDYYILNCSPYPSAIVECGFLSNREDDALLCNDDYRERLAYRIYCGIISYLSTTE